MNPLQKSRPQSKTRLDKSILVGLIINLSAAAVTTALITSCVTVNVNLPESAVQAATDDYVRDLYRAKEKGKTSAPQSVNDLPRLDISSELNLLSRLVLPSAYAAETFNVTTPKTQDIRQRLLAHLDDVLAQKRAGVLGETNDGRLTIKDSKKLKPLLASRIEKLVKDENQDRADLYNEVAASNNATNRVKDIAMSFARSFQAESPSGTWVQDADGKWSQKP